MVTWSNGNADVCAAELFAELLRDETGQDLIEYALIFSFIALGAVATMKGLAANLGTFFGTLGTTLTSAV